MTKNEVERVREIYRRREESVDSRRYTPFDPAHLLLHFSRQSAFLEILKDHGIHTLRGKRILEVGCGAGEILSEYLGYGAVVADLFGVDLLQQQLSQARERFGKIRWICADGSELPFVSRSFDLVVQHTVFSSVLANGIRDRIASEMQRVVRSGGLIVSYDFWPNNPWNADVRGVTRKDIERMFPGCRYRMRRAVLAPPIARRIAPYSRAVFQFLESIPWACTHYMIGITPAKDLTDRSKGGEMSVRGVRAPKAMEITVRSATRGDVPAVADIHIASFQNFFLSFLGWNFLYLLYEGLHEDPESIFLIAERAGRIVGFAAGTMRQESFYRRLIRRKKWRFAASSLGALLRKPSIARRLLRALVIPRLAKEASAKACLMSIAVDPATESRGVGRHLAEEFCTEVARRGGADLCLTTDRDGNDRVNRFYELLGFVVARTYVTPEGRYINEYYKKLGPPEARR